MAANLAGKFLLNSLEAVSKQAPDLFKVLDNPNPATTKIFNSHLSRKGNEAVGEELVTAVKNQDFSNITRIKDDATNQWNQLKQGNQQGKRANPTDNETLDQRRFDWVWPKSENRLQAKKINFNGYETLDDNTINEYARNEVKSYVTTGHGSGNYLYIKNLKDPTQVKRIKLNSENLYAKGEYATDPVRTYSWKDVDVKNLETSKYDKERAIFARATTTNKKNLGAPQVLKPMDTIWHHSIPNQTTGKIYEAYMKYSNPNFKLTKNAPRNREFLRMLKEIEEEFGVKFGDDPLNARYLKDKPDHDLWHKELTERGIDSKDMTRRLKGRTLNPLEAREWLREVAKSSIAVDEARGFDRSVLGIK